MSREIGPTYPEIKRKHKQLADEWLRSMETVSDVCDALTGIDRETERNLLDAIVHERYEDIGKIIVTLMQQYAKKMTENDVYFWIHVGYWHETQ